MKSFKEYVDGIDPEFLEAFEKGCEEDKECKEGDKKPFFFGKKGKKDDKKEDKVAKKDNPFLKKGKKEEKKD